MQFAETLTENPKMLGRTHNWQAHLTITLFPHAVPNSAAFKAQ
jgi:hypothetical protein